MQNCTNEKLLDINYSKILLKNVCLNLILPRRSLIYIGYQCHLNCKFCYYKTLITTPMFLRDYVLRLIDLELLYGIHDFEITGGEPGECKDLAFYCDYIKSKSPTSKIAVITNGSLYNNKEIWQMIDEVLVSYHMPKDSVDLDIFPNGNTFNKVNATILLARSNNKVIRTNTVIGTFNIHLLDDIVKDLILFKPDIVNFLPINLFDNAQDMEEYIDYVLLRIKLKHIFDVLEKDLPTTLSFVRYMPFCDMQNYEKHIVGSWQHIFDWFDWNPELNGQNIINYINLYLSNDDILKILGNYGSLSFAKTYDNIKYYYQKSDKCLKCKYYFICDGVEKTKNNRLLSLIVPCNGKAIKDPMFYIKDTTYNFYSKKYGNTL